MTVLTIFARCYCIGTLAVLAWVAAWWWIDTGWPGLCRWCGIEEGQ